MRKLTLIIRLLLAGGIVGAASACAPDIQALAQDPATGSLHFEGTLPGYAFKMDYTRVNSTGTAAAAGANGTAVNVPAGATVNPAPAKAAPGVVLTPGAPAAPVTTGP